MRRIEESLCSGRNCVRLGKCIYTSDGKAVKKLGDLHYNQKVFLSPPDKQATQGLLMGSLIHV